MRRWGASGGTWATVGLVVLAAAALVLAFAAMRSTRATPVPTPSGSALAPADEDANQPRGNEPDDDATATDALPEAIEPPLLMVDTALAYRGRTGTCLGGAALEGTTNGGRSWRPLEVPAEAILDLRTTGADSVEVVGADEQCRVRVWSSPDRGQTWSGPSPAGNMFVRLPDTARDIATPTGVAKNPCRDRDAPPLTVEQISATEAMVLCADGEVIATTDGGLTWVVRAAVVGAQAMAFEGPQLGWVLVRDGGRCPSYEAQVTQDGGVTWNLGGCLGETRIADDRVLPSLSFATPSDGLADLAGEPYVTPDGGRLWQLPG